MYGVFHRHVDISSVIIQIIDIYGVTMLEPERHPPVARDRHREMACEGALERVRAEAGQIHAFGSGTAIQSGQDAHQFCDVVC